MVSDIIPARIAQLRGLAGLSKTELAVLVDVTPSAVSQWESGTKKPGLEKLLPLAQALKVSPALLQLPFPSELVGGTSPVSFRARASARTRLARERARRLAELSAEIFAELSKTIKLPTLSLPELDFDPSAVDVNKAAEAVRETWGLGLRPILRLGDLLESKGIILIEIQFGDVRYDAFSCILNGAAMVFLGGDKGDRARRRFDAAHELGHLVLHQYLTQDQFDEQQTLRRVEKEADAFASAFLLPRATFLADLEQLGDLSLSTFLRLKPRWGVSAQAMVRRAHDLNAITDAHYTQLCRAMAMRRWRGAKQEPGDDLVPSLTPSIGPRAVQLLNDSGATPKWQLAEQLPMPAQVWRAVADFDPAECRVAELDVIVPFPRDSHGGTPVG